MAEKTKKLYGYTGTKTVNKKNCYIFVIYDKNDDVLTKVATVAAEVASDKLYVLDDETGSAEKSRADDSGIPICGGCRRDSGAASGRLRCTESVVTG